MLDQDKRTDGNKMLLGGLLVLSLLCMSVGVATAQEGDTVSLEEAKDSLNTSIGHITQMKEDGLSTNRVEDIYIDANTTLTALREGGKEDFSRVVEKTQKITDIKDRAFQTRDELDALRQRVKQVRKRGINTTEVEESFSKAVKEFRNERYENAQEAIENTYDRISEAEAVSTQVEAFTAAAQENVMYYLSNHLWEVIVGVIVVVILVVEGWREYRAYKLVSKRESLKIRKHILDKLIEQAQRLYFKEGDIAESTYNIQNEKYSTMILDVNRELPVLQEQIEDLTTFVTLFSEDRPAKEYAEIIDIDENLLKKVY